MCDAYFFVIFAIGPTFELRYLQYIYTVCKQSVSMGIMQRCCYVRSHTCTDHFRRMMPSCPLVVLVVREKRMRL